MTHKYSSTHSLPLLLRRRSFTNHSFVILFSFHHSTHLSLDSLFIRPVIHLSVHQFRRPPTIFLEGSIYEVPFPSSSMLTPHKNRNLMNPLMKSDNSEHYAKIPKLEEFFGHRTQCRINENYHSMWVIPMCSKWTMLLKKKCQHNSLLKSNITTTAIRCGFIC